MGASHSAHLSLRTSRSRSTSRNNFREHSHFRGLKKSWSTNTPSPAAAAAFAAEWQGDAMNDDSLPDDDEEELSVSFGYRCKRVFSDLGPDGAGGRNGRAAAAGGEHYSEPLDKGAAGRAAPPGGAADSGSSDGSPGSRASLDLCAGAPANRNSEESAGGGGPAVGTAPFPRRASSFSQLSGAALSANATLANTTVGNNNIGSIVLPGLDSPREFRALARNPSTSNGGRSSGGTSPSGLMGGGLLQSPGDAPKSLVCSAPTSFLGADDVQMAGGAAGEDRVQAVCSESNGWLFCGVYDGFNGRDAADFLAAHLYESLGLHLQLLQYQQPTGGIATAPAEADPESSTPVSDASLEERELPHLALRCPICSTAAPCSCGAWSASPASLKLLPLPASRYAQGGVAAAAMPGAAAANAAASAVAIPHRPLATVALNGWPGGKRPRGVHVLETIPSLPAGSSFGEFGTWHGPPLPEGDAAPPAGVEEAAEEEEGAAASAQDLFRAGVVRSMKKALAQLEADYMDMVEQEMRERQDLAMVGSCVLGVLMHGADLFALNLGDSRAVLATQKEPIDGLWTKAGDDLFAVQLTETHNTDQEGEMERIAAEHRNDPTALLNRRVKGKLRVTRAFGALYMKHARFNDNLMGLLRVRNLHSPPYISTEPFVAARTVGPEDRFLVLGSDGLFDFYSNEEVVDFVWRFVRESPGGDPAKFLLEQLLLRVAERAGMTVDELKSIPFGRRRKYHDDVTVVIVTLGNSLRTTSASTLL